MLMNPDTIEKTGLWTVLCSSFGTIIAEPSLLLGLIGIFVGAVIQLAGAWLRYRQNREHNNQVIKLRRIEIGLDKTTEDSSQ